MRFERLTIESDPVISAVLYTANDQMGAVNTLDKAAADTRGSVKLESITVIDKAKQKVAFDIFFFAQIPTLVSVDNQEFELLDAEMLKCLGVVSIAAGDYADSKNSAVACKRGIELILQAAVKSRELYYVAVTRGGPTYAGGAGDLRIKFGFLQP